MKNPRYGVNPQRGLLLLGDCFRFGNGWHWGKLLFQLFHNVDITGNEENIRRNPRHRVGEAHGGKPEHGNNNEAHDASCGHFKHARKDGGLGKAQSLNGKAVHVNENQRNVQRAVYQEKLLGIFQNLGGNGRFALIQKQAGNLSAKQIQHDKSENRINRTDDGTDLSAFLHPWQLPCADILPGVGGDGGAQRVHGTAEKLADLAASGNRGDIHGAQTIYNGLHDDAANGGDGILQTHGYAHSAKLLHIVGVRAGFLPAHFQNVEFLHHVDQTANAGHALGNDGGPRGTGDAHMKYLHRNNVQHNIHSGGQQQEIQRGTGIAQRADDAGQNVVQNDSGNAQENDENIGIGFLEKVFLGIHQHQNFFAGQTGGQGDDNGKTNGQIGGVCHKFAQTDIIFLPEFLGNGDGEAGTHAGAEAQHQKVNRAGGANACQGVDAQIFAHDDGIHHIVKLLENQAAHQR